MLYFLLFHIKSIAILNDNDINDIKYDNNNNSCPGPNSIRLPIGICQCRNGFPFGDPNDSKGCWKCQDKCDSNAECVYPGKCVCKESYFGDGIKTCEMKIPKILSYTPSEGKNGTIVNISYSYPNSLVYKYAFCKFGSIPVNSIELTDNYMLCSSPQKNPSTVTLSISFDAIHWSSEDAYFTYLEERDSFRFVQFFLLSIAITLSSIFSIDKIHNYLHKKNDDESIPLINRNKKDTNNAPYKTMQRKKLSFI